ncbi:unnamed protein product [Cylicostephanus goldi]|uniref:Uncharacterized protein n=1 Tax=Cylicostephanus goldi TaxID=71465 RepID=A0A3P6RNI1_CYLGO|nr:unnamed protein product [Cylicostephanus goldi]
MIKKKLDSQLGQLHEVLMPSLRTECELEVLRKESDRQRHLIGALETEVFGARLAAKYLDKPAEFSKFNYLDEICAASNMIDYGTS